MSVLKIAGLMHLFIKIIRQYGFSSGSASTTVSSPTPEVVFFSKRILALRFTSIVNIFTLFTIIQVVLIYRLKSYLSFSGA